MVKNFLKPLNILSAIIRFMSPDYYPQFSHPIMWTNCQQRYTFHTGTAFRFLLSLCIKVFLWRVREGVPFSKGTPSRLLLFIFQKIDKAMVCAYTVHVRGAKWCRREAAGMADRTANEVLAFAKERIVCGRLFMLWWLFFRGIMGIYSVGCIKSAVGGFLCLRICRAFKHQCCRPFDVG